MREWYALAAIERAREQYPDLTREEEDSIYDFHIADDGRCLFLRCGPFNATYSNATYFPYPEKSLSAAQIRDLGKFLEMTR